MVRPIPVLPMQRGLLPAKCRAPPHEPSQGPCRYSALGDSLAFRGRAGSGAANLTTVCKTWQRSARRGIRRFTRPDGTAGDHTETTGDLRAQMFTTMPAAEAPNAGPGAGRGSGSPVLAVLVLGERLEPPLDLSDPALELLDLTTRRPELLHDRLGQTLELPLERGQQTHPPGLQVLHRPLRALLDIHTQLPDIHQRENLVNHRLAAAFDQLARVVPQLADQPLSPPPQPPDRSTNIVQREKPCLCLFHEALLSSTESCGSLGQLRAAQGPGGVRPVLVDSSTRRAG